MVEGWLLSVSLSPRLHLVALGREGVGAGKGLGGGEHPPNPIVGWLPGEAVSYYNSWYLLLWPLQSNLHL